MASLSWSQHVIATSVRSRLAVPSGCPHSLARIRYWRSRASRTSTTDSRSMAWGLPAAMRMGSRSISVGPAAQPCTGSGTAVMRAFMASQWAASSILISRHRPQKFGLSYATAGSLQSLTPWSPTSFGAARAGRSELFYGGPISMGFVMSSSSPHPETPEPRLTPVYRLDGEFAGEPLDFGDVGAGHRRIVPLAGGTF